MSLTVASSGVAPARRRAVEHALFGFVPLLISASALFYAVKGHYAGGDFRHCFYVAALRLRHGGDVYGWSPAMIRAGLSFPYPALTALLLVPFTLLSEPVSGALFVAACVAAILGVLRVLGIRDWRLYGLVLAWPVVVIGWQTGNLTLPLALGLALAWRVRDRPAVLGGLVALTVSIKPNVLPVLLWLLATRRHRALAYAAVAITVLNVASWSLAGWSLFGPWLHLVSQQSHQLYRGGYGLIGLVVVAGGGRAAGTAVAAVVACAVALAIWRWGRRGADGKALVLVVLLMFVATPLVDYHYLAFAVVPLAVTHRRLHWAWVMPLALWVCPATGPDAWQVVLWWLVALSVLGAAFCAAPAPAGSRYGVIARDSIVVPSA